MVKKNNKITGLHPEQWRVNESVTPVLLHSLCDWTIPEVLHRSLTLMNERFFGREIARALWFEMGR